MNLRPIALALALVAVSAQAAETAPAAKPVPQTPEAWLQRMTDFTQNASAYKDPKVFNPWLNAVTEPGFYTAMGQGIMDPAGWLNMMNSMAHPDAARNWMGFSDPNMYVKWMQASMDPAFYTAMLSTMTDPGKMMRWVMVPMDPKMWNLMLQTMNPNTYMKWGTAAMDPRAWQFAGNVMNPALYTGYMGAMVDPKAMGSLGPWFAWKPANAPTGASNPWGSTTAGTGGFNFFDPMAWAGMVGGLVPNISLPSLSLPTPPAVPVVVPPVQKITLSAQTLFKLNKSGIKDLTEDGKKRLDNVAARIKEVGEIEVVKVIGHADASGKAAANKKLSEARAKAVKAYLVSKGVKEEAIAINGAGDSQPLVKCDMKLPSKQLAACLEPNRRVEIEIVAKAK